MKFISSLNTVTNYKKKSVNYDEVEFVSNKRLGDYVTSIIFR